MTDVKVGDFFACSWGYDQTNVTFYKVVGMTASGKSVKVQEWSSKVDHSDIHDYVVPGDSPRMRTDWSDVTPEMTYWEREQAIKEVPASVETKRLRLGGYKGASFYVASYADAYLWDGKPQYQTGAGYGH